jgi:transposase
METEPSDKPSKMIQQITKLRGIGVQTATVLVREAFVRRFANVKALGSYAGLASSPYSSGGMNREQGIGKAGNPAGENSDGRTCVAMDPLPARFCASLLVPRTG